MGGHPDRIAALRDGPTAVRDFFLDDSGDPLASQVLTQLPRRYYRPVDTAALRRASVDDMLKRLNDPYTAYLDPSDLSHLQDVEAGRYSGVGIEWHPQGGRAFIVRSFPGSPAARAGVGAGDRVVRVDGHAVKAADGFAAMQRVRGPDGTKVRLDVARGPQPVRSVELVRSTIREQVVQERLIRRRGRPIGYVRLEQFTQGSAKATRAAVRDLTERGARGVVLDLRGDPGGLVAEAIGVASVFLPKGAVIATTSGAHEKPATLKARGGAIADGLPLFVLVDRGSASASEIVAGALRDDGRATLVGTRTFGKAVIQSTVPLRGGGALKLTVASYRTPKGEDLAARGLRPAVAASDDPATRRDEALEVALARAARG